jgi:hypothetical protein
MMYTSLMTHPTVRRLVTLASAAAFLLTRCGGLPTAYADPLNTAHAHSRGLRIASQTRISAIQIKSPIVMIERWKCTGTAPPIPPSTAPSDCTGIEYHRYRYLDNTISPPFLVIPAGPFTLPPTDARWVQQPVEK